MKIEFALIGPLLLATTVNGYGLFEGDGDDPSVTFLGLTFARPARKNQRSLTHTVPPFVTPWGCQYNYEHNDDEGKFTDEIFCPNWCGDGQDFQLVINTLEDADGHRTSTADCRLPSCNQCNEDSPYGSCPCPLTLTSFSSVCSLVTCDEPGSQTRATITSDPTDSPTAAPTPSPTVSPTVSPTATPTDSPTVSPSSVPTSQPSQKPSGEPSAAPSAKPSLVPSAVPSVTPTASPTEAPTEAPTVTPTATPSVTPSAAPTVAFFDTAITDSDYPSMVPSDVPSMVPSDAPSVVPSDAPSMVPVDVPTSTPPPSDIPSASPFLRATPAPSENADSGGAEESEGLNLLNEDTMDAWSQVVGALGNFVMGWVNG